jgi:GT2 family glycosyltransferase/glycosyltransferase involved in cell wall biosynthesis
MTRISVIVPVYNALAMARQCVQSIFDAGSAHEFEVVVVDNGSEPDVEEWLRREERLHANLRHLRYPHALGFASAVNRGAESATGQVLIVLNSDTLVSPGWIEGLAGALASDPSLGAITPCTNHAGEPAQMDFNTIDLAPPAAWSARSRHPHSPEVLHLPQRITFFAVAIRREVWLAMDGLSEAYPVGNFEDDDFCLRLRVAGYRLGVARHVFVYHHNNGTFEANRLDHAGHLTRNAAVFAARARQLSEDPNPPTPRWPRRPAMDISVVIHPNDGAPLERTLRSLANQTVHGFEILPPDHPPDPTRPWIAHVAQGDILYPFHLESLFDALSRSGAEAIFADLWDAPRNAVCVHPDAESWLTPAPRMLAGWMHHASLDIDRLREQTTAIHWPRLTWETGATPPANPLRPPPKRHGAIHLIRRIYRRSVPLDTRLALDATVRRALGLKPANNEADAALRALAVELSEVQAHGRFAIESDRPAVVQFNAVSWHSATQRQHHFARGLAERGHPVLWVETGLRPPRRWWTGAPLPQVAPGLRLVRLPGASREIYHMPWSPAAVAAMAAALRLVASAYGFRNIISLVNYPRWQPLVAELQQTGWKTVYDCLDDQLALADLYQTEVAKYEERLIADASLLFTSSVVLRDRLPASTILLHNGADTELFSSASSAGHFVHLPRPVIGFFGALADWLDMDLIRAAALRFPAFSFVYIGPQVFSSPTMEGKWLRSTDLPNITRLPQLDQRTLAAHLADFDVCIMPFLDIPVTRAMNAVKLYEYLAAGKPTISRGLPEIRHMVETEGAPITLYNTPEEFFDRLQAALHGDTPELTGRRRDFARRNDWNQRVDILSTRIYGMSSSSAASSGSKTRSQE